jgi:hypothetical protein
MLHIGFTNKKKHLSVLLGILLLVSFMVACTPDPNEAFIQGNWYYNDLHIQEVPGESYSESFWNFSRGTFDAYTCCFVKYHQYGRYDIVESEGDTLTLVLFNIDGNLNSERVQIGIRIDRETDTIRIQGGGPFTRTLPK